MKISKKIALQKERRRFRVRNRIRRDAHGRPRMSVHRSNRHIYVQIIDDQTGTTLCSASSQESAAGDLGYFAGNCEGAGKVGQLIAERAAEKGIREVVFDRGLFKYHGRIAAVADAARAGGLTF